jgi:diacylglycerol kinase (ATP)
MAGRKRFTLAGRMQSVKFAVRGIGVMLATQHNARIHAVATMGVLLAGCALGLAASDWCDIVLAITAVWTAEAFNTAFEFLTDVASPEFHPLAEKAKDVAAAAVLIASVGAVAIGALVFVPHVSQRLGSW